MQLLKMRSARIIKAPGKPKDPEEAEMAARARAVMRQLRGVKLNLSDERITFDDVAGIGEAKACPAVVCLFWIIETQMKLSWQHAPALSCGHCGA